MQLSQELLDEDRLLRHGEVCGAKVKEGRWLHCPVSSLLSHIVKVRQDSSVFSGSVVSNESSLPHVCLMTACLHLLVFPPTHRHRPSVVMGSRAGVFSIRATVVFITNIITKRAGLHAFVS